MVKNPENYGEIPPSTAEWGGIDRDGRLHVPKDVLSHLSWYQSGRCEVLIELRERGSLLVHERGRREELDRQRRILLSEFADRAEALRRIAFSRAFFIPSLLGESNRRIILHADVLVHLGAKKNTRALCLAYADCIEVMSEERAADFAEIMRADINLAR